MKRKWTQIPMKLAALLLHHDWNRRLGIERTMRWCERFHRVRRPRLEGLRQELYRSRLRELLRAHDGYDSALPAHRMVDGFCVDRSGTLPGLAELVRDSEVVIAERGGQDRSRHQDSQQPWFYPLHRPGDITRFPSFLDFPLSSQVISTVAHEMGTLPYLSNSRPPALRLMESNSTYDTSAHLGPRESQLFHLDMHASPLIYAIVLLRDTSLDSGPWHFLSASTSARVARQLRYQKRGVGYRLTDAQVLPLIARDEVHVFTGKAGDVLFINSSACFHYGSRAAVVPRYQMMYAFTGPTRSDLQEFLNPPQERPVGADSSELRRLVLAYPC